MYSNELLNEFNGELFPENDTTVVETAKAECFMFNRDHEVGFDEWLDYLVRTFCDCFDREAEKVYEAIDAEPEFKEKLRDDFEYVKDMTEEFGF